MGLLLVLVLVAVAGVAWLWLRSGRPPEVRTAPVVAINGAPGASAVLNASGYVTARRRATVSSKITGKVTEVLIEEGMQIKRGAVVARLDGVEYQAALKLARSQQIAAQRAVDETQARIAQAELDVGRLRRLVAEAVSPQAELDLALTELTALQARLALQQEQIEVASREVAVRRIELDNTVVRAPFDGVVISKDAQPGEIVSPISAGGGFTRTGLCTVVDMNSLEIEVDVNESYIRRVRPDQPVEAILDAYPDWQIPARVITTIPTADRQKATVRVRIGFEELDRRILPDMGVKVAFLEERLTVEDDLETTQPRLEVPDTAVRSIAGRDVVFVVVSNKVERRAVQAGRRSGSQVEIVAGLRQGELVVVDGPADLGDGARVRTQGGGR